MVWLLAREQTLSQDAPLQLQRPQAGVLIRTEPQEIKSIQVTHSDGEGWYVQWDSEGRLADEKGEPVDASVAEVLISAASTLGYVDVVTNNPEEYVSRMDEFGLDTPDATVNIAYQDGKHIQFRIGGRITGADAAYYYMVWSEDDALYAIDSGSRQDWMMTSAFLHPVPSLGIHGNQITRIRLQGAETEQMWELQGDLMDASASDHWWILEPIHYPADGNSMQTFISSLENLRL